MKNRNTIFLSLILVLFVALGCGLTDRLTGSKDESSPNTETGETSSSDSKSEVTPTGEIVKVGIPECDELATFLNDNAEVIGKESIVVRGIVEMYKQTIFSNLRDSVEKMSDEDKVKTGENCKKALENVKKQVKPKE